MRGRNRDAHRCEIASDVGAKFQIRDSMATNPGREPTSLSRKHVDGETTDRQVFWLPDRPTDRAFPSVARQWLDSRSEMSLSCRGNRGLQAPRLFWLAIDFPNVEKLRRSSPDTAAGPRRIRTVFPILWRATHPPAPRSRVMLSRRSKIARPSKQKIKTLSQRRRGRRENQLHFIRSSLSRHGEIQYSC
jgi:hypothetical protein